MRRTMKSIGGSIALLLMVASLAFAASADKNKGQAVEKTTGNDLYRPFLINNVFNYYGNNGDGSYNKFRGDNEGFEYPKGGGGNIIFEDGVVWGGSHKTYVPGSSNGPKVGGSVYRHGLQAGKIIRAGGPAEADTATGDDPTLAKYRVFRVRPDINPKRGSDTLLQIIHESETPYISRYESYSDADIMAQYLQDWNEWPAGDGAPFQDVNGNGTYEPGVDIPGVPGADQTLWYVANDASSARATYLAGCPPIGIEMQRTIWGYNRAGALGSTIFASTLIINKSGAPVDSMFMVQWADPDLGDAGDDFAGCDVPRSLGYIYNGGRVDATYGVRVPAGGFTFFQGPLVPSPGDSAVFRLKYKQGFKNLGMSTFVFFTQGFTNFADPAQGTNGNKQWYNLMNGLTAANGVPFIDPTTGIATKFTLNGDPVTGQGWLDGMAGITAQDRRICLVTGPFRMANGDTQELVVANVGAQGNDRVSSVALLRFYSDLAQSAYNGLFNIPNAPPPPKVTASAMDQEVVLSWGEPTAAAATENSVSVGYQFEGYNVYQLVDVSKVQKAEARRIATYDKIDVLTTIFDDDYDPATGFVVSKPVQFGTDIGISRKIVLTTDAFTSANLVNGTPYYYAVTAYSWNPSPTAKPKQLENALIPITVIPHSPNPGTRYGAAVGDTLTSVQTVLTGGSVSEGLCMPIVVDPTKTTGHQYRVNFRDDGTGTGGVVWDLYDVTASKFVARNMTNQTGDEDYPLVDGLLVKVTGPASPGMKDWAVGSTGVRHWTWVDGQGFGLEGFDGGSGGTIGNGFANWFSGSTVGYGGLKNVEIRYATADGTWDPRTDQSANVNFSKAYRYLRGATSAAADPSFVPWIVNPTAGYAFQEFNWSVPFAAYDIEATPARRLAVGHLENNTALGLVDGRHWPRVNGTYPGGTTNVSGTGPREWWFVFDVNYSTTADASLEKDILNETLPIMWMGTVSRRSSAPNYVNTSIFTIFASHINTANNVFTFTSPAPVVGDKSLAAVDVDRVNVYPNPYFGFNTLEQNKYARFVKFTHLPQRATIRIFNLAGVLIRTIQKNDDTQFAQWDLKNENAFPASAGVYIAYIDMPDLGKTKTLKLSLIPEQQYLDRW